VKRSFKKVAQTAGRILIGVLLLFWIFHAIFLNEAQRHAQSQGVNWQQLSSAEKWQNAWTHGPPELWETLTLVSPGPLVASILLMGAILLLGVVRWLMVLRVHGLALSPGRALEISCVAHFFNSFLLGSTGGDLMKAYYAARETHHKKTEAVVTVFVDRLIGLWAMLLFASLMMLPNLGLLRQNERARTLAVLILGLLAACTMVVLIAFYGGVSKAWTGARGWLRRLPKGEWLERLLDSCRCFGREPWFVVRSLGVSMGLNTLCVIQVLILSLSLGQSIPPLVFFVVVPMIICISAIPITPSGLGVRENLYVLVLAEPSLGVEATSALSLSLLAFAGSLFWSLVGGMVYMTLKGRHHLRKPELSEEQGE
jgi:uncharacterized protein (TIRG00374 family)